MKNLLKSLILAAALALVAGNTEAQGLSAPITSATAKGQKFLAVPLTTGSTVVATNGATPFTSATFYGYATISATGAPVANTNTTYIGFRNSDGTATNLLDTITAGSWISIKAPPGTKYDLKDVCFKGATGEKIQIVYEQ